MGDLNEVRVADNFMDRAQLEHDKIIGASSQAFHHSSALDQLRSQYIKDSFEDEFDQGDPFTLLDPLVDPVHARRYEVSLVGRRAPLQSARNVVGFLEGEWFGVDIAWEKFMAVQVVAFGLLDGELLALGELLRAQSIRS